MDALAAWFTATRALHTAARVVAGALPVRVRVDVGDLALVYPAPPPTDPPSDHVTEPEPLPIVDLDIGERCHRVLSPEALWSWLLHAADGDTDRARMVMREMEVQEIGYNVV